MKINPYLIEIAGAIIKGIKFIPYMVKLFVQYLRFSNKNGKRFSKRITDIYPLLYDNTSKTLFDPHYIYHPAWAARIIAETKPALHTDISSTLAFCTMISAFVPVKFFDYRPADILLNNLSSKQADLLKLAFEDNSIESLSCMHVVEHIGLGRYGDKLDYDGDLKAIAELKRVLAKGGNLLFVVPVSDRPRIMFNAHRIYSYGQIISYFKELRLMKFSVVLDNTKFIENAVESDIENQSYACGCFWFRK